jgi:hypothetical protein
MVVNRGTDDSVGADGKIRLLKGNITIYGLVDALIKVIYLQMPENISLVNHKSKCHKILWSMASTLPQPSSMSGPIQ